jgi:hypothetical protein
MQTLCQSIGFSNDETLDMEGTLKTLRTKFKICASLFKSNQAYDGKEKLSF